MDRWNTSLFTSINVGVLINVKIDIYYINYGFEIKLMCIFVIILRFICHMKLFNTISQV